MTTPDPEPAQENPVPRVRISSKPLDAKALAGISKAVESPGAGAVVLFVGNVRDHHNARAVEAITYTAYEAMAKERMERIVRDLCSPGLTLAVHHRIGRVEVGAASVMIAAASAHRHEAYAASRKALERLKTEVPIWKKEHYADGETRWREEEPLLAT